MKRSAWFGPFIGAVLWITGLTFVMLRPIRGWLEGWPDSVKLGLTLALALALAVTLLWRARTKRREFEAARADVDRWFSERSEAS